MPEPIFVDDNVYHHHSRIDPSDGSVSPLRDQSENRQSYFKRKRKLPLDKTAGAYVSLGGRNLLLVIDKRTVRFGSPEWKMIAATAKRLEQAFPTLDAQAKAALATLRAVIFSAKPLRSFADVEPNLFFYDTDEFRRSDGSLVDPSWTASCVVHDANHVWQKDNNRRWHGVEAEVACWHLQVDNAGPLGLSPGEVTHIKGFIADPESIIGRAGSDPFGFIAGLVQRLRKARSNLTHCLLPPPKPEP